MTLGDPPQVHWQYPYGAQPYYPSYPTNPVLPATNTTVNIAQPMNLRLKALELAINNDFSFDAIVARAEAFYAFLVNETDTQANTDAPE